MFLIAGVIVQQACRMQLKRNGIRLQVLQLTDIVSLYDRHANSCIKKRDQKCLEDLNLIDSRTLQSFNLLREVDRRGSHPCPSGSYSAKSRILTPPRLGAFFVSDQSATGRYGIAFVYTRAELEPVLREQSHRVRCFSESFCGCFAEYWSFRGRIVEKTRICNVA